MQAIYDAVHHFLGTDQQFTIPIFQRRYNWTKKQCEQLFDDMLMIGQSSDATHFLGSVVHLSDTYKVIPTYRIIDGQQRLTTLILLLSALARFLKENSVEDMGITSEKLINKYIINRDEEGDLKYKIKLNEPDNKTLHEVINYIMSEKKVICSTHDSSKTIWDNYSYFFHRITEENAKILFDGFLKLYLIIIRLDEELDNPQLIFESLNSKGLTLSKSDLIRNYVLMGLKPHEQDAIYKEFWEEMEQLPEIKQYTFDRFIKDYLTTKQNKIPVQKELYNEFKRYAQKFIREQPLEDKFENIKALTKDIYKYFKYFEKFYAGEEEDDALRLSFKNVYVLGQKVITPFFLHLYDDYDNGLISNLELFNIVNITESYIYRRNTCDLSNQSLKTIFAGAYEKLDKNNYFDSYQLLLLNEEGEKRFPKNREFGDSFVKRKIYNKTTIEKYKLGKLENFGHEKEPTNIDSLSIEHIMPQKEELSEEWQKELGRDWKEIQEKYLHTIGNLTLTGYNQKLSYLPFHEKRDMVNGFKDSNIRLNKPLANLNYWNENQIIKRASDLRKEANKIWPYPKVQKKLK